MYLIYGAGEVGRSYIIKCEKAGITDFDVTDSKPELWGSVLNGHIIISPEDALKRDYEYIIVAAEHVAFQSIVHRLDSCTNNDKVISYGRTIIWDNDPLYDMGNIELTDHLDNGIYLLEEFVSHVNQKRLNDLEKFVIFGQHSRINKCMHYFEAYDRFFSKYRGKDVSILEIGVRGGGSVQMWKNYFGQNGGKVCVYGIDIDERCKQYEEDNIQIFIGSQEDRTFLRKIKKEIGKLDIIIDDGGHTMNQQIVSLEELWDCVKDGGTYLCEDTEGSYVAAMGGSFKGKDTFIEYTKNFIDDMYAVYSETKELAINKWTEEIKDISYYKGMVFIEKYDKKYKAFDWIIEENR